MRTTILFLLTAGVVSCGPDPAGEPIGEPIGEPPAAGLPGTAIDPSFEYAEMPYTGDQDPGADIPGIDP